MLALQLSDGIQMVAVSLGKGLGTVFLEAAQAHQQGYKNPLPSLNSKTVNLFSFEEWNKKKKGLETTEILWCLGQIPSSSHLLL